MPNSKSIYIDISIEPVVRLTLWCSIVTMSGGQTVLQFDQVVDKNQR